MKKSRFKKLSTLILIMVTTFLFAQKSKQLTVQVKGRWICSNIC